MSAPVLLAMLVADKVFREAETGKVHIAGTFNRIGSAQFPFYFPQLYVYMAMSDMKKGEHELGLELRHMEENSSILKVSQPIESPSPLEVLEVVVCFNRVPIPAPGNMEMILLCDSTPVTSRVIRVVKAEDMEGAMEGGETA